VTARPHIFNHIQGHGIVMVFSVSGFTGAGW